MSGFKVRRLRRAVDRLARVFGPPGLAGGRLGQAADDYGFWLMAALRMGESHLAVMLFRACDERIPSPFYDRAFDVVEEGELIWLARRADGDALEVIFGLAMRLRFAGAQRVACESLAELMGPDGAVEAVARLEQWYKLKLLDSALVERALCAYLAVRGLESDGPLWRRFFGRLPRHVIPDMFEVHALVGRGVDAARVADTLPRKKIALEICLAAGGTAELEVGLELARVVGDQRAESECHEGLGDVLQALTVCPDGDLARAARLVEACRAQIEEYLQRHEYFDAADAVATVVERLMMLPEVPSIIECQQDMERLREVVTRLGRRDFEIRLHASPDVIAVHRDWSRFEERSGNIEEAASHAIESGDLYRAHVLFRDDGRFGEAVRVLEDVDTDEGRVRRAQASESGGDALGAARLYRDAGRWEYAVTLLMRTGAFAEAASALIEWQGDDAVEDPRLAESLLKSGSQEELALRCLRGTEVRGAKAALTRN